MHPANRLALWLWLAALLPWLERQYLYGATAILVAVAFVFGRTRLMYALIRIRWLLLFIVLIYGWTTPGAYIWFTWLSPTYEGVFLGLAQGLRLIAVVAGLQLLLTGMDRKAIFAGLYTLLAPLDWFGSLRNRLVLRLGLTLEVMEELLETHQSIKTLLKELGQRNGVESSKSVVFPIRLLSRYELLMLLLLVFFILITLFWGGFGSWV